MKQWIFAGVLMLVTACADAQESLRLRHFNLDEQVALSGYDPVAYFTRGKAVKGNKRLTARYEGVLYYFSDAANRDAFLKNPAAYEPQYGGWCAYAMGAKGEKVPVDPETFKVLDGKLYLFYNRFFNNTLTSWNKDESRLKSKADASWKTIYH